MKRDVLANVFQNCGQIQGCGSHQHGLRWDEVTGFMHPRAEPRLGNDILVGIVERRVRFAFESQKLSDGRESRCMSKNSAKKRWNVRIPHMTTGVGSPARRSPQCWDSKSDWYAPNMP